MKEPAHPCPFKTRVPGFLSVQTQHLLTISRGLLAFSSDAGQGLGDRVLGLTLSLEQTHSSV